MEKKEGLRVCNHCKMYQEALDAIAGILIKHITKLGHQRIEELQSYYRTLWMAVGKLNVNVRSEPYMSGLTHYYPRSAYHEAMRELFQVWDDGRLCIDSLCHCQDGDDCYYEEVNPMKSSND